MGEIGRTKSQNPVCACCRERLDFSLDILGKSAGSGRVQVPKVAVPRRLLLLTAVAMVVVYAMANDDPFSFYNAYGDDANGSSSKCTVAAKNSSLLSYNAKNGGIPSVLGVNVALWAVSLMSRCARCKHAVNTSMNENC